MTTLTITPNLAKKTAKFAGAVAAGEHVEVTLKYGASIADTSSLRMRVVGPCGTLAIFPQPESEDAWEVDGEDLKCVLNLNTIQMLKALAPAIEAELLVVLDDAENHVLYFKDTCAFKHWPMRRGDDAPYDLDGFPGLIEEWREEIDNLAASVEKVGNVATISITDKDGTTTAAEVRDGEDGEDGEDGTDGVGIPAGGTTGQILVKASATDYDTEWRTAGGGGGEQANWNETDSTSPAYIRNKPTSFLPSAHKNSHKAGGSDAIAPSDIGALPSNAEDIDGYVMSFGGAQYALQTPYTQSGIDGWGTSDGAWKLFVAADGTVLLLKDGAPKPTNPLSVAGLPLPWNLQLLDGSGTAVVADAGSVSTGEIIGHLRSRSNPHGVTAAQVGLGNVDNTSDANKPISTAVQNALNQKANTSTTYTKTEVDTALGGKVDKAAGKGIVNTNGDGAASAAHAIQAYDGIALANFDTTTKRLNVDGIGVPSGVYAFTSELPYSKSSTVGTRQVLTITATTSQSVTLPAIPNTDEVFNCDIVVNGTAATADFGLTLVGGTGVSVYYPNGEAITCKAGCVTMVSCVGINGLGWLVVGCNNLKTAS